MHRQSFWFLFALSPPLCGILIIPMIPLNFHQALWPNPYFPSLSVNHLHHFLPLPVQHWNSSIRVSQSQPWLISTYLAVIGTVPVTRHLDSTALSLNMADRGWKGVMKDWLKFKSQSCVMYLGTLWASGWRIVSTETCLNICGCI